jgi:four helix bundle protein
MQDFRKLDIWKRAMDYAVKLYKFSSEFPENERYGLVSQLRRSAYSIPLNIAEGAGSDSNKEFKVFLGYAHRSIHEVLTILELSRKLNLIRNNSTNSLAKEGKEIRAMIFAFMKKL